MSKHQTFTSISPGRESEVSRLGAWTTGGTTGGTTGTELRYFYNSEGALVRIEQYSTTLSGGNGSDIELHSTITGRTLVSTERYYYDSANRATRIIRRDADNDTYECRWEYDHNNNVTNLVEIVNGQTHTSAYTYDLEQRISQFVNDGVTWSYTYDADGLRTGRTDGTNTYQYIYAGDKLVRMIYNGEVVDISYAGSQPLSLTYDGATYYYVLNGQGDVIGLTDSTGTMAIGYTYGAYGTIMALAADENLAPVLVQMNPLTYRGYVYDRETKFFYLQSRYYDPELGRFINADALVSTGQGVLGNNMFAYCNNNPAILEDNNGNSATIAGGIVGGIGGLISVFLDEEDEDDESTFWEDLFSCVCLGVITGAAAGFFADVSVATWGVGTAAFAGSAIAGGGAGIINSAGSQLILDESVDGARVIYDGFWGALMGGTCTVMGTSTMAPMGSVAEAIMYTDSKIAAEMTLYSMYGYIPGMWFDLGSTAVTAFGAWLAGIVYTHHANSGGGGR